MQRVFVIQSAKKGEPGMAIVMIHGIAQGEAQTKLEQICDEVKAAISDIEELRVTPDQIFVDFQPSQLRRDEGKTIIAFVSCVHWRPDRAEAIGSIPKRVCGVLRGHFPKAYIKCPPVKTIQPGEPYYYSSPKPAPDEFAKAVGDAVSAGMPSVVN